MVFSFRQETNKQTNKQKTKRKAKQNKIQGLRHLNNGRMLIEVNSK